MSINNLNIQPILINHIFLWSSEFCAHKDFCRSGPGLALIQCEWKGRGSRRVVPESHPDRDGGSSLPQGKRFWLHWTSIKTRVFWASLCLYQVILIIVISHSCKCCQDTCQSYHLTLTLLWLAAPQTWQPKHTTCKNRQCNNNIIIH